MSGRRQLFNINLSREAIECNIAIVGELGVGKSAITVKYLTKRFIMEYDPMLEDVYQKNENIDGQDVVLKIMDTYDTVEKTPERYLKWASGIVVLYSITNRHSFETGRRFLEDLSQYEKEAHKSIPVILVGNKLDLERYRTVSKADGQELATQYECLFHETSAADDFRSVELLFHGLIRKITRPNDGPVSLQPLFISEDSKGGLLNPLSQGIGSRTFKRTKSPGSTNDVKDGSRLQDKDQYQQRRMPSTFKIFKSRFNIFN